MEHLSPEWIVAYDEIVRAHPGLRTATTDRRLVIVFMVGSRPIRENRDLADPEEISYTLVLDHGSNRVVAGSHPNPDITLRTDLSTAAAIASHGESAQAAFMDGRMRLGGDARRLIANQDLVAGIDDCARSLRDQTEFGTAPGGAGSA